MLDPIYLMLTPLLLPLIMFYFIIFSMVKDEIENKYFIKSDILKNMYRYKIVRFTIMVPVFVALSIGYLVFDISKSAFSFLMDDSILGKEDDNMDVMNSKIDSLTIHMEESKKRVDEFKKVLKPPVTTPTVYDTLLDKYIMKEINMIGKPAPKHWTMNF